MEPSLAREAQGFPSAPWRACAPIKDVVWPRMILFPAAIPRLDPAVCMPRLHPDPAPVLVALARDPPAHITVSTA